MTKIATPEAFSAPVPSIVLPSRNVTVPAGAPAPGATAATAAVNVTAAPVMDGVLDDVSFVAVAARFTCCCSATDVLCR